MSGLYEVFADESATDKSATHMVYGGVCILSEQAASLRSSIDKWKSLLSDAPSEFHWSKTSSHRLETYKNFAGGTLRHAKQDNLFFRSMVLDKSKLDYRKFHNGDRELGFYKFWYQFLLHGFIAELPYSSTVRITLDERQTSYSLTDLKKCLNGGVAKKWGSEHGKVIAVEPGDSAKCHFLQMADILTGAVSHQNNRHRVDLRSSRGAAKEALAGHIQSLVGEGDFTRKVKSTPFEVWHFEPSGK